MSSSDQKPELTKGQKRLLALVYIMGGILVVLFVVVMITIIWQLATLH